MADLGTPTVASAGALSFTPSTTRTQQLGNLSNQVTQQISGQAQQQQNARVAGMQSDVQAAKAAGARATAGQVQQAGAQQAAQAGQIGLSAATTAQTRQGQIGAMGLQEEYGAQQASLSSRKLALDKENSDLQNQLATTNRKLKQELVDKQMTFQTDALGRTLFNDRQLMDYQVWKATSSEDLQNYEQAVSEASRKRQALLETAHKQVIQSMQDASSQYNQSMSEQQKAQLLAAKQALEIKLKKEKASQAARASMFEGVGTIFGAVAGGVIGSVVPGAGTAVGAGIGAAAGAGLGKVAANI